MRLKRKDYVLVALQMLVFILYIFDLPILKLDFPEVVQITALISSVFGTLVILVAILQLNKNLSPFPTPKSGSRLIETGLYKYVRHPIYTGILMTFSGFAIFSLSGYRLLLSLILYIVFVVKVDYEERKLSERFRDYKNYRKRTGRFFPKFNFPEKL